MMKCPKVNKKTWFLTFFILINVIMIPNALSESQTFELIDVGNPIVVCSDELDYEYKITQSSIDRIYASGGHIEIGTTTGDLSDTYYKDLSYIRFTEDCGLIGCDGLDVTLNFTLEDHPAVDLITLNVYHRVDPGDPDFELKFWDYTAYWSKLETMPYSGWNQKKYEICSSLQECSYYLSPEYFYSGTLSIKYYHHPCGICNTDHVDVNWLYLELFDTTPPTVLSAQAQPYSIRANGNETTLLTVNATDLSGVSSVTVNLSAIGGKTSQAMSNNSGLWQFTANATIPGTFELPVNATDNMGNSNTSAEISLEVVPNPTPLPTPYIIPDPAPLPWFHQIPDAVSLPNPYQIPGPEQLPALHSIPPPEPMP